MKHGQSSLKKGGNEAANTHPHPQSCLCLSGTVLSFIPAALFCLFQSFLLAQTTLCSSSARDIKRMSFIPPAYVSSTRVKVQGDQHLKILILNS